MLAKKSLCVVSGPITAGKQIAIEDAYKVNIDATFRHFMVETLEEKDLMGCFQEGLWREGILRKYLK